MKRRDFTLIVMMFLSAQAIAQDSFRFKREAKGISKEGWHFLRLPPDIFQHLDGEFGDCRLYSVIEQDTVEIPYLLQVKEDQVKHQAVDLPLFNKSFRGEELFLMFELRKSQWVNYLDLDFKEDDFFAFVTVEGSDNRNEWFEIARDLRIVSLKQAEGEYHLSTIQFPVTDFRFLRLRIEADRELTFRSAQFARREVSQGVHREIKPLSRRMTRDAKAKVTYVNVRLSHFMPLSFLSVDIDSTRDYHRPFRVEYVYDSIEVEKRWKKLYRPLLHGYLTSYTDNEFSFDTQMTSEVRLVIEDFDNPPLDVEGVRMRGPEVHIVAQLKPGNTFLLYGNKAMHSPTYDLAHFQNKIPEDIPEATLGAEQILSAGPAVRPLLENRLWLWVMMVVVISVLGFFTIRMMGSGSSR